MFFFIALNGVLQTARSRHVFMEEMHLTEQQQRFAVLT